MYRFIILRVDFYHRFYGIRRVVSRPSAQPEYDFSHNQPLGKSSSDDRLGRDLSRKNKKLRVCLHASSQGLSQPDLFHYASAYHGDERALMYG